MTSYDAIVVGARCAGAATAMLLARSGHKVLLLDRDEFPSDMVASTHMVWHAGIARLKSWGLLNRLKATGSPPMDKINLDLGMFVQNVLLVAAGRGLQSCPQETFAKYHRILRPLLSIPAEQMVVCGISIGRAQAEAKERLMPRADVDEFATFAGFEA